MILRFNLLLRDYLNRKGNKSDLLRGACVTAFPSPHGLALKELPMPQQRKDDNGTTPSASLSLKKRRPTTRGQSRSFFLLIEPNRNSEIDLIITKKINITRDYYILAWGMLELGPNSFRYILSLIVWQILTISQWPPNQLY